MGQERMGRKRYVAILLLLLVIVLFACLPASSAVWRDVRRACGLGTFSDAADDAPFALHVLDVGKADSLLLECGGEAMLVDGGTPDRGEEVAQSLTHRGIDSLRYVVNTHPDADHIGGLPEVLQAFPVAAYIAPELSVDTVEYRRTQQILQEKAIAVQYPQAGTTFSLGGAEIEVWTPPSAADGLNNHSLVLRVVYGDTAFLLMGDAEREEEEALLASGMPLRADVLKVGHHGSDTSTGKALLDAVQPRYAAISTAWDNSRLPRETVLRRLRSAGVALYRTDVCGTLLFLSDGETVRVVTENEACA